MKQAVNAYNFVKTLDSLKQEYKTNRGGYHQQSYRLMAIGMSVALLLRANKKLKHKFIRHVGPKSDGKGSSSSINLVTEVMAYIMGAKTESNRKIAWKRGRVIEFLYDQGIKIAKTAAEIHSRGGIEAVYKQAAKQKPRRDKGLANTKTMVKKSAAVIAASSEPDRRDRDESDAITAKLPGTSPRNDGHVIMPVLINLSDRDLLYDLPAKSRVKIYATCGTQKQAKIEVSGVKKLKPEVRKLDDDDDWD